MKFFLILSRRRLGLIAMLSVIVFIISGGFYSAAQRKTDGSTHQKRMEFIGGLGYEVSEEAGSKEIVIPYEFGEVYSKYNELQKNSGFDLYRYRGKKACVYTYPFLYKEDTELHLIVSEGVIIGGDIASIRFGGEMKPL